MASTKTKAEMIGEALREVGVLAAVFIPLDHLFSDTSAFPLWGVALATVIYGGGLWFVGMKIEETRQ